MEHHWVAVEAFQQRTSWFHRGKCQEMISHRDTPFGNINEDAKNCALGHRAGLSYISSDVKTLMCWQNKTKSQLFFHTSNFYHSFYVHVHHSFTETCPCQKAEHKCYSLTCSFNWMQFSATWPGHSFKYEETCSRDIWLMMNRALRLSCWAIIISIKDFTAWHVQNFLTIYLTLGTSGGLTDWGCLTLLMLLQLQIQYCNNC